MKKHKPMEVLASFAYDRIRSFTLMNPFCITFCYTNPKYQRCGNGEFIIKGGINDVDAYIKRLDIPMLMYRTLWRHGRCRDIGPTLHNFNKFTRKSGPFITGLNIGKFAGKDFYRNYEIRYLNKTWLRFRTIPRKWLKEYDELLSYQSN